MFSVALRFSIATPFGITLGILSVILALCRIPRHLHSYYTFICSVCIQWLWLLGLILEQTSVVYPSHVQSSCSLLCGYISIKVFSFWFVWDCIPLPPIILYILIVGVVIVSHVCSHVSTFHWPLVFSFRTLSQLLSSLLLLLMNIM